MDSRLDDGGLWLGAPFTTVQGGSGEAGMTDEGWMAWWCLTELWCSMEGSAALGCSVVRPALSSWLRLPKRKWAAMRFGQSARGR
jgi:hypothetical protein